MKKQSVYTAPIVEVEMIDVEMGIAMSTQELGGFGNIDIPEEDVVW